MTEPIDPEHLLAEIARFRAGAAERDQDAELPRDGVRTLARAGLGALRVPIDHGGAGLSLPEAVRIWIAAAVADSNLPQIFRAQFTLVEDQLHRGGPRAVAWLERFAAGEFAGSSWSERNSGTVDGPATRLRSTPEGLRLDGSKYYTTGSIYADLTDTIATDDDGVTVAALVALSSPGVTVSDDWDGFGQRLTGTGSLHFEDTPVDPDEVLPLEDKVSYQTALYQLVLLATLAGIARRATEDVAAELRARTRVYSHGTGSRAGDDPQLLAVVGQVGAAASAAEAIVVQAAHALQAVSDLEHERGSEAHTAALDAAELATAEGQVVLSELVPAATTKLFDALGASATSRTIGLDRHWRNARTVASHNPVVYKQRVIGDHLVNGTPPIRLWGVGAPGQASAPSACSPASTAETPTAETATESSPTAETPSTGKVPA